MSRASLWGDKVERQGELGARSGEKVSLPGGANHFF